MSLSTSMCKNQLREILLRKMTENLKAVYKTVSLLPMPVKTNINDLFAAVDRGEYNTSSAPDDDADIKNFCEVVYYYEAWNQNLRDDFSAKGCCCIINMSVQHTVIK